MNYPLPFFLQLFVRTGHLSKFYLKPEFQRWNMTNKNFQGHSFQNGNQGEKKCKRNLFEMKKKLTFSILKIIILLVRFGENVLIIEVNYVVLWLFVVNIPILCYYGHETPLKVTCRYRKDISREFRHQSLTS